MRANSICATATVSSFPQRIRRSAAASAEEGADEAATGGDAVVELLVDEGAGHKQVSGAGWDEESEAGRQRDGLSAGEAEGYYDCGA